MDRPKGYKIRIYRDGKIKENKMDTYKDGNGNTYEATGEFRNPNIGEFFLYEGSDEVDECFIEYTGKERRVIVKESKPEPKQPKDET